MPGKDKKKKYEHTGHRGRMRNRVLTEGAEGLADTELVEMMLYYCVPFVNTTETAKALLARFGSVEKLLRADPKDIAQEKGLGDSAAVFFTLFHELAARGVTQGKSSLLEPSLLKPFLLELFDGVTLETVYALYFTSAGEYLGKLCVVRGSVSSSNFKLRTVTEGAIKLGGTKVIFAHNHPSDTLIPSNDDIIATRAAATHLLANGIDLVEHYIVGKTDCVGMLGV